MPVSRVATLKVSLAMGIVGVKIKLKNPLLICVEEIESKFMNIKDVTVKRHAIKNIVKNLLGINLIPQTLIGKISEIMSDYDQ